MGAVWVTRSGAGGERTRAALAARGYDALLVPLVEIVWRTPEPAPAPPWPNRILFVSANAVEGLARALAASGHAAGSVRSEGAPVPAAAVGERTAEAARRAGFTVDLVPEAQRAEGLLEGLRAFDLAGRRIWIPAGTGEGSASRDLPGALRARAAEPVLLTVYATEARLPDAGETALLSGRDPGAVLLHSPSAARAFVAALSARAELARWRGALPVAIGPVTATEVRRLELPEPVECDGPSDEGVLGLLDRLASIRMAKE